ncbi:hypothetical protein HDU98_005200 [Podochytrium sp. JEL0797]|nr:hypothetical protein HDU98_005200 [Podochytrium sp. JEL0797]
MGPPRKKLPHFAFAVYVYSDTEEVRFKLLKIFATKLAAMGYADDLIRDAKQRRKNAEDGDSDEEEELALRFATAQHVVSENALYDKYSHGYEGYLAARYAVQRVEVAEEE